MMPLMKWNDGNNKVTLTGLFGLASSLLSFRLVVLQLACLFGYINSVETTLSTYETKRALDTKPLYLIKQDSLQEAS